MQPSLTFTQLATAARLAHPEVALILGSGMSDVAGIDPRVAPFFQSSTFDVRGSGGRHHAALQFLN